MTALQMKLKTLLVVGAHLFSLSNDKNNEYTHSLLKQNQFEHIVLVEANPRIVDVLKAQTFTNTTIVNAAACAGDVKTLKFYALQNVTNLPSWASQISSYSIRHIRSHLGALVRQQKKPLWTWQTLYQQIVRYDVPCLNFQTYIHNSDIVLVDIEGLDCKFIEKNIQEFCKSTLQVLSFEVSHCNKKPIMRKLYNSNR